MSNARIRGFYYYPRCEKDDVGTFIGVTANGEKVAEWKKVSMISFEYTKSFPISVNRIFYQTVEVEVYNVEFTEDVTATLLEASQIVLLTRI
jgi:hypothetical protein